MKLLTYPNEALNIKCDDVKDFNEELHKELDAMLPIMKEHNGMGLAANQVGLNKRLFIMKDLRGKLWECINPIIIVEHGVQLENESCLSFPDITVQIKRPEQIRMKAFNRYGEEFEVGAYQVEAICVCHEIDHLNGETFLNRLSRQQRREVIKRMKK